MTLLDLNPRWWSEDDHTTPNKAKRHGQGLSFDCPSCVAEGRPVEARERVSVALSQPLDGGKALPSFVTVKDITRMRHFWMRDGFNLSLLTLSPSIDCSKQDHGSHRGWHGSIVKGEVSAL